MTCCSWNFLISSCWGSICDDVFHEWNGRLFLGSQDEMKTGVSKQQVWRYSGLGFIIARICFFKNHQPDMTQGCVWNAVVLICFLFYGPHFFHSMVEKISQQLKYLRSDWSLWRTMGRYIQNCHLIVIIHDNPWWSMIVHGILAYFIQRHTHLWQESSFKTEVPAWGLPTCRLFWEHHWLTFRHPPLTCLIQKSWYVSWSKDSMISGCGHPSHNAYPNI